MEWGVCMFLFYFDRGWVVLTWVVLAGRVKWEGWWACDVWARGGWAKRMIG